MKLKIKVKSRRRAVKIKVVPNVVTKKKRRVSLSTIADIFDLYCQDISEDAISSAVGVTRVTIHKYIEEGDPRREVEPLRLRRARVLRAALQIQDGKLAERAANIIQISSASAGLSGQRFIARTRAAMALDHPENLSLDEQDLAEKIAVEPTTGDFVAYSREFQSNARLAMLMNEPEPSGAVTVNVNQSQQQEAKASSDEYDGGMDLVYQHIQTLASSSPQDHNKVARMVRDVNLGTEGDDK